jgi:putative ABC transport system substrate-binding protein
MTRVVSMVMLIVVALAAPLSADAQPSTNIPRIGFLTAVPLSMMSARTEAFRQGLRELGYVEGKTIVIEWRSAEGQFDRLPSLAAELVRLKVDVIVTAGPLPTRPVKAATVTIPIVITNDNDPVANGFVASLARPGGNITGMSTLSPEIYGKQLELLKEIVPRLSRVAVLGDSAEPGHAQELRETERAARTLRVQLQYLDVRGPNDIESVP